jgi:hypothetical protein
MKYFHTREVRQLMFKQCAENHTAHHDDCLWMTERGPCTCGYNESLLAVKHEALRKRDPKTEGKRSRKEHA